MISPVCDPAKYGGHRPALSVTALRYTWARNTFDRIMDLKLPARPGEKRGYADIQVANSFWRKLLVVITRDAARYIIRA